MEEYPGTFNTSCSMTRFESHRSMFSKGFYNEGIHGRVISKAEWRSPEIFPHLQYKNPLLSRPFFSTSATPLRIIQTCLYNLESLLPLLPILPNSFHLILILIRT